VRGGNGQGWERQPAGSSLHVACRPAQRARLTPRLSAPRPTAPPPLTRVPYIHSCRGGTRSRRTKRSFFPWACTLLLIGTAWFKLFVLSSLMNKLAAHVSRGQGGGG
jgi:hypothetical protein